MALCHLVQAAGSKAIIDKSRELPCRGAFFVGFLNANAVVHGKPSNIADYLRHICHDEHLVGLFRAEFEPFPKLSIGETIIFRKQDELLEELEECNSANLLRNYDPETEICVVGQFFRESPSDVCTSLETITYEELRSL